MHNRLTATLALQRRRLLQSYVVHVIWFVAMIATAIAHTSKAVATTSIWLALITVPPVIVYAALVHKTCRAIDPSSRTIGLIPMILMTIFLTPFESGLIVPAKNLMVPAKLLRQLRYGEASPNESFKPNPRSPISRQARDSTSISTRPTRRGSA